VREAAVNALAQMGGFHAIEPFIATLKDNEGSVRRAAVKALGKIGDPRAVEALIVVLKDNDNNVREAAGDALDKIGWQPGQDEDSFAYWTAKVKPLIAALESNYGDVRRSAAKKLVELYRSGFLDKSYQDLILMQRDKISSTHNDTTEHTDYERSSDCAHIDFDERIDKGIGVAFPV
jgi:HEAT repeat protein